MRGADDGEELPPADLDLAHVVVNVDSLDDFRALLGRELDANLRPGAESVNRDHALGVGFGARNAGARVQVARQLYHASLATSMANLAAYVTAAETMIDAIRRVSQSYREADAGAARANEELAAAFRAAQQTHVATVARARDQETRWELHRQQPESDR